MTDSQKIAKRILRMIEAGEVDGNDPFVINAGVLAEMVLHNKGGKNESSN